MDLGDAIWFQLLRLGGLMSRRLAGFALVSVAVGAHLRSIEQGDELPAWVQVVGSCTGGFLDGVRLSVGSNRADSLGPGQER